MSKFIVLTVGERTKESIVITNQGEFIALALHCQNFNLDLAKQKVIKVKPINNYEFNSLLEDTTLIYKSELIEFNTLKKINKNE